MDTGLLALRVVVGLLLVGHGAQKLFGWFGGGGLTATAWFFRSLGYRPSRRMAGLAGSAEVIGGAALAVGLGTPLASAAVIGRRIASSNPKQLNAKIPFFMASSFLVEFNPRNRSMSVAVLL